MSKLSRLSLCIPLLAIAFASGCGGDSTADLDFADWIVDVPEGTPLKEYAAVSLDDRTGHEIELVEDLVLGGDPTDPNTAFYRVAGVVASEEGNIFVLDSGNNRVQMFGSDGSYLKTLGGPGQGPGEFQSPLGMAITEDRIVINDLLNSRLSFWSLDGEHLSDVTPPQRIFAPLMNVFADGSIVAFGSETDRERMERRPTLTRYSPEGERLESLLELPATPLPDFAAMRADPLSMLRMTIESMASPSLIFFAIGGGEVVYATPVVEYQVFAKSPTGEWIWALRTAWPRPPFPEAQKEALIASFAERMPDQEISVDDFDWPEHTIALGSVQVDGQGRIYVFPVASSDEDPNQADEARLVPVDVYSPQGERLLAGLIGNGWAFARGDYVYTVRPTPDDEVQVVRYRLVWPEN